MSPVSISHVLWDKLNSQAKTVFLTPHLVFSDKTFESQSHTDSV